MSKFDDVRIPLSYFKEIVSKEQLSILKYAERTDKFFQTRCLTAKGKLTESTERSFTNRKRW